MKSKVDVNFVKSIKDMPVEDLREVLKDKVVLLVVLIVLGNMIKKLADILSLDETPYVEDHFHLNTAVFAIVFRKFWSELIDGMLFEWEAWDRADCGLKSPYDVLYFVYRELRLSVSWTSLSSDVADIIFNDTTVVKTIGESKDGLKTWHGVGDYEPSRSDKEDHRIIVGKILEALGIEKKSLLDCLSVNRAVLPFLAGNGSVWEEIEGILG